MSEQTTNGKVRDAALVEDDVCARMARTVSRLRRRQLMPHAVAAGLLSLGYSADLIAFLTRSQALTTAAVALLAVTMVAALMVPKVRDRIPEKWRGRALLAGLTGGTLMTLASLNLPEVIGYMALADLALGAGYWKHVRDDERPKPEPITAPEPEPEGDPEPEPLTLVQEKLVLFNTFNAAPSGPLAGATLRHVEASKHTEVFHGNFVAGGQTLGSALMNLERIGSGLHLKDVSEVMLDRAPGQRLHEFRLQLITNSPMGDDVVVDRVRYRNGVVDLGPFADGNGEAPYVHRTPGSAWSGVIIGETGTGKGRIAENLVYNVMEESVIFFLDPQGGSSSPAIKKHADFYLDLADAPMLYEGLRGLADERGRENDYDDVLGLDPIPGVRPNLTVVIDECHEVFKSTKIGDAWGDLAREVRKLGIHFILISQYNGLKTFGNSSVLRASVMAGNAIALRNMDNSAKGLMPGLPVDPKSLPKIPGYGYTTLGVEGTRTAPFRNRLPVDANALLVSRPHLSLDAVAAYGFDSRTDGAYSKRRDTMTTTREYNRARIEALRAGETPPPPPESERPVIVTTSRPMATAGAVRTTSGGGVLSSIRPFPSVEDYLNPPSAPALPELTQPEMRYLSALDELGGKPRMRDMERALNLEETRTRNLRDALVAKGLLVQLAGANGKPVKGRYGRPGTTLAADDTAAEEDNTEQRAAVGATA